MELFSGHSEENDFIFSRVLAYVFYSVSVVTSLDPEVSKIKFLM